LIPGIVTPAAFGFAACASNAARYGTPFHFGPTGIPGALSPALPHPAKNAIPTTANPPKTTMHFLTYSSHAIQTTRQNTTPAPHPIVIAKTRPREDRLPPSWAKPALQRFIQF
jgi:hypothetical protein